MAIEIIPKKKAKISFWPKVLLAVGLILLLAFLGSYFYLQKAQQDLSEAIEEKNRALVKTPEERTLEESLLLVEAKVKSFGGLLSKHKKTENVFKFLEEITHPKVWFSSFDLNTEEGTIGLSGTAEDFVALEQQRLILLELISAEDTFLKAINLSGISMEEGGGINFSLQLTLDPQIFK